MRVAEDMMMLPPPPSGIVGQQGPVLDEFGASMFDGPGLGDVAPVATAVSAPGATEAAAFLGGALIGVIIWRIL